MGEQLVLKPRGGSKEVGDFYAGLGIRRRSDVVESHDRGGVGTIGVVGVRRQGHAGLKELSGVSACGSRTTHPRPADLQVKGGGL